MDDTFMVTSPDFGIVREKLNKFIANAVKVEKVVRADLVTFPLEKIISPKDKL